MKYYAITLLAFFAASEVNAACPEKVTVTAFTDNKCKDESDKTKTIQQEWDFLAKTFSKSCYENGNEYLKWTCTDKSIKASVYEDKDCSKKIMVGDHAVEMGYAYGECQKYGDLYLKVAEAKQD